MNIQQKTIALKIVRFAIAGITLVTFILSVVRFSTLGMGAIILVFFIWPLLITLFVVALVVPWQKAAQPGSTMQGGFIAFIVASVITLYMSLSLLFA